MQLFRVHIPIDTINILWYFYVVFLFLSVNLILVFKYIAVVFHEFQEAKELHDLLFTFIGIFHEKFLSRYHNYYECYPMLKKNHVKIISVLYQHKHLIPTEIGKLLDVERGSLTALIDQLEEMGLVKRLMIHGQAKVTDLTHSCRKM